MDVALVLTVIGQDRPGIVESLSRVVAAHEANWEESRMAHLASRFAGILRVTVSQAQADALTRELEGLSSAGLRVTVERTGGVEPAAPYRTLRLELLGNDRPGIVREISRCLAERGVNIEELETERVSAAMTGGDLFKAQATLRVPPAMTVDELRRALESLANEMMVDLNLGDAGGLA
ncbi:glycine cleavage system protein R [Myxococcota bacterium]|nr:glycine cleavage system protein R [Myxococcota bacterium]